jgi:gluconolactonase
MTLQPAPHNVRQTIGEHSSPAVRGLDRRSLLVGAVSGAILLSLSNAEAASKVDFIAAASGLRFPEGPVVMTDGSVVLCEIAAGRVSRVQPSGQREVVAEMGGGPNGCAIGPDGAIYVCNNGGLSWIENGGKLLPGGRAPDYAGGHIDRLDLKTGRAHVLYHAVDGIPLSAPNDLVFDDRGGFWFTDTGAGAARSHDYGGLYYAKFDGSFIREAVYPMNAPNGIALSPDGKVVYVALTYDRLVLAFPITGDGTVDRNSVSFLPGRPVATTPAGTLLDSMKAEADGTLCVAIALSVGGDTGILRIRPNGEKVELISGPEGITNIAFGGKGLRTAYITESITGRLLKATWPAPGLKLNYQSI